MIGCLTKKIMHHHAHYLVERCRFLALAAPLSALVLVSVTFTAECQPATGRSVVLLLHPDKTNYVAGQPIGFSITLSNLDETPLRLGLLRTWDIHEPRFPLGELEVSNHSGHAVQRVPPANPIVARNVSGSRTDISGKGAVSWHVDLAQKFLLTNAGYYTLVAKGHVADPDNMASSFQVQAAPLQFQIEPSSTNSAPRSKLKRE